MICILKCQYDFDLVRLVGEQLLVSTFDNISSVILPDDCKINDINAIVIGYNGFLLSYLMMEVNKIGLDSFNERYVIIDMTYKHKFSTSVFIHLKIIAIELLRKREINKILT